MKQFSHLERDATQLARVLSGGRDDPLSAAHRLQSLGGPVHAENHRRGPSSFESFENAERSRIVNAEDGADIGMTVQNDPSHFASRFASVVSVQAIDDPDAREIAQGAEKSADPIEIACDTGAPDNDDVARALKDCSQMPRYEFASLNVVGGHDRVRATRACIYGDHGDAGRPNLSDAFRDAFGIDRIEDYRIGPRSCERPQLFKLTPKGLVGVEDRHLHASRRSGRLDRMRFGMKERIGEILNDESDRLEARWVVELSRCELRDADANPISSRRIPSEKALRYKRFADVEDTALRRFKAACDAGQGQSIFGRHDRIQERYSASNGRDPFRSQVDRDCVATIRSRVQSNHTASAKASLTEDRRDKAADLDCQKKPPPARNLLLHIPEIR